MKEKWEKIKSNDSSVFWSALIVALMAIVKAFTDMIGVTLAPDFIDKALSFFMAIIAFLVVAGILKKNNTVEPDDIEEEKKKK